MAFKKSPHSEIVIAKFWLNISIEAERSPKAKQYCTTHALSSVNLTYKELPQFKIF